MGSVQTMAYSLDRRRPKKVEMLMENVLTNFVCPENSQTGPSCCPTLSSTAYIQVSFNVSTWPPYSHFLDVQFGISLMTSPIIPLSIHFKSLLHWIPSFTNDIPLTHFPSSLHVWWTNPVLFLSANFTARTPNLALTCINESIHLVTTHHKICSLLQSSLIP